MFKKLWMFGGATAIVVFLGTLVFARPNGTEATLVVSEGEVVVEHGTDTLFAIAAAADQQTITAGDTFALSAGDTVQLGDGAAARLRLRDGSTVDLSEEALLHVVELTDNADSYQVRLFLFAGRAFSRVFHLVEAGDAFTISTPSSTTSVRGTVFSVRVLDEDTSEVAVEEGLVWVTGNDNQGATVPAGYQLTVETGQPLDVQPQLDPTAPPVAVAASRTPSTTPTLTPSGTPTPEPTASRTPNRRTPTRQATGANIQPVPPARLISQPATSTGEPPPDLPAPLAPPAAPPEPSSQPPQESSPPQVIDDPPVEEPPIVRLPTDRPPTSAPPADPPTNAPPANPPHDDPPPNPPQDDPPTDPPTNDPPANPPQDDPPPRDNPPPGQDECPGNSCGNDVPSHVCDGPAGASNPHCRDQ